MLGFTVLFWKRNFKSSPGGQVQLSLSASTTAAGSASSSGGAHFTHVWYIQGLIPTSFKEEWTLSTGCQRDQSTVQPAALQRLESARSPVRLGPLARMGAGTHQMDRQTCNEQTCAKWLGFALNIVHID